MGYSSEVQTLIAEGSKLYAAKDFDGASEKYSEACEKFQKKQGSDDADLLFLYGRSLFQCAVSRSEVLGGGTGVDDEGEKSSDGEDEEVRNDKDFELYEEAPLAEEEDEGESKEEGNENKERGKEDEESAHEPSVEEEKESEDQEQNEQEQNDFEIAWEILDTTASLLEEKAKVTEEKAIGLKEPFLEKDSSETKNEYVLTLKKLSETYDLLGEVSLEAENFAQAAVDLEKCLELRKKVFNPDCSSLISESHYKLSLALEFCVEDPGLKEKAAEQMKLAIDTVKKRASFESDSDKIKQNEELIQDLEVRYQELTSSTEEIEQQQADMIKTMLGKPTGNEQKKPPTEAVNDLSSIVKKKNTDLPVNDLSALVKKRKANEDGCDSKKSKDRK